MANENSKFVRQRALRAAQVVTLGLALAGGGGCYAQHDPNPPEDASMADALAALPELDAGGPEAADSAPDSDLEPMADAAMPMTCVGVSDPGACCQEQDWPCDGENSWGCCAWGPYAPPEEGALPTPRSVSQRVVA